MKLIQYGRGTLFPRVQKSCTEEFVLLLTDSPLTPLTGYPFVAAAAFMPASILSPLVLEVAR